MTRQRKHTLALCAVLLAVLGAALALRELAAPAPGLVAVVQVNGRETARLPLSEDAQLPVEGAAGAYNLVRVEDGAVSVTEANCPDLTCVRTGKISAEGQIIACLPHRLVVSVTGEAAP